jgi:hypothetical protein
VFVDGIVRKKAGERKPDRMPKDPKHGFLRDRNSMLHGMRRAGIPKEPFPADMTYDRLF